MSTEISGSLNLENQKVCELFAKACRKSILEMTTNASSGHPGGSLSSIDFLTVLYTQIISKTGEKVVVSNGHISPAVYAVLAEMGYVSKEDVVKTFRKIGSVYEGHVTRQIPGIYYGTGPLGIGVAVAAGVALMEKRTAKNNLIPKVFVTMGDGETQEGEVYEMMNFAAKYKLDNLIGFVDFNQVQLTDAIAKIMPINIKGHFEAAGWEVIEVDGHDYQNIWAGLVDIYNSKLEKPKLIIAKTVMGKGVDFMEKEGLVHKSTWHGKAASLDEIKPELVKLSLSESEDKILNEFRNSVQWKPLKVKFSEELSLNKEVNQGSPVVYEAKDLTDCRTAYGKALLDLAKHNKNILALSADLSGSVMTKFLIEAMPDRHIECGIAEQMMVSAAGGISLNDQIPFVSTFGAFMTSRAKDQARVNDVNRTNVKMVATHCGLSVGEDGPTHQAIDDSGSMLGLFNTMVIEPADPNQTDRVIRFVASHYGNFYVRMGRHKYPVITNTSGEPLFGEKYIYEYGRTDYVRPGENLTVVAIGPMVYECLMAWEKLKEAGQVFDLIAVSSIKKFDSGLRASIKRTGRVLTVEDHNLKSGLYSQVATYILEESLPVKFFDGLGVKEYQLSGKSEDLYKSTGLFRDNIVQYLSKKDFWKNK